MYTTLEDLIETYGEPMLVNLTDRGAAATGVPVLETIDQAIADATALIDGYLAVRYALPLASTPPLIASLARDIAIYKLHVYDAPEMIRDAYKAAIRALEAISAGRIRLEAEGIPVAETGSSGARVTDRARPMTHDNLKGY